MSRNLVQSLACLTLTVLAVLPSASAALIGHWTLDNDTTGLQNLGSNGAASDLAAATPSGTISGGPTFTATGGAIGGYATFDGNQALVTQTVGNIADVLADYPFTMAAWIRPTLPTTTTVRGAAVSFSNSAASNIYYTLGVETRNEGSDAQAVRRNTAFVSTEGVGTSSTVNNGAWHHLAVVNESATSSLLYLNGVQVGQSATSVTFSTTVNTLAIGAFLRSAGYIDKYFGDIDDVRIYDVALSQAQVRALVPEPSTLSISGIALLAMTLVCRKRKSCNRS